MNFNFNYVSPANKTKLEPYCSAGHFLDVSLSVKEIKNGIVRPKTERARGGVYEGQISLEESLLHRGSDSAVYPPPSNDELQVLYDDAEVVYVGMLFHVWGHCLTDNIKHLWFLLKPELEHLKSLPFVYVTVSKTAELPENFFCLLERLGIKKNQLRRITKPTRFKTVYLPDACFINNTQLKRRQYTAEYKGLIQKVSDGITASAVGEKVYFTRSGIKSLKDLGEKRIENVFKAMGYKIISPETMPLEDQISVLKGCNALAGTDGSVIHNCIFLAQGANLVIVRKANYLNGYQAALNDMKNLCVTYVDAHKSVMAPKRTPWSGPFFLYVSRYLARFSGTKQPVFPFFSFFMYVCISLTKKFARVLLKKPYKFIKRKLLGVK